MGAIAANAENFDPFEREKQLRAESESWDTSTPENARDGDIPVIDLSAYFRSGSKEDLKAVAEQLRVACETVGFFTITGHGISTDVIDDMFAGVRRFHDLPLEAKRAILMDRPDWALGGVGYLPVKNRKLPARATGNLNEAFIVKTDHKTGFEENQWPDETALPGFRQQVEEYGRRLEELGRRLLPIFATALEMTPDYFDKAFEGPLWRLRMTHYPPVPAQAKDEFGIAPHVDTTFCTILAQDRPGLTIFDERRSEWIKVPLIPGAFIVNTGELLRQWSNDRFKSVKHFANNNTGETSRYSIPFFLNANATHRMGPIPSCVGPDNPHKYPVISYAESQAVAQGE